MSTGSDRSDVTFYHTEFGAGRLYWRRGLLVAHRLPDHRLPEVSARTSPVPVPAARKLAGLLESCFAGEAVGFDIARLPLDLSGLSEFYLRLATALAGVAYGQTTSYGALAAAAGRPRAARAAGNFLAANPFPVILPCHRVVRSDGGLGGFSGGAGWKRRLLALEGAAGYR